MARDRNPIQVIYLAERVCGICSFSHITCFVRAVEDAAKIPVPRRAQYIRSLLLELERVHSHILWAGVACYTIGYDSAFHLGMQLREKVMDVLEALTGNRVNYGVGTVGGVRRDITPEVARAIRDMLDYYRNNIATFTDVVFDDPVALARMRHVGPFASGGDAVLRAGADGWGSGLRIDLRWSAPYEAYGELDVTPIVPRIISERAMGMSTIAFSSAPRRSTSLWTSSNVVSMAFVR
jgi:membrane-bound hydrogenase subunit alpha